MFLQQTFFFVVITFLIFMLPTACAGQNDWKVLKDVELKSRWDETHAYQLDYPEFGKEVRGQEGKLIRLKGYILPLQAETKVDRFIFSQYPFNQCYFCGGAGPETVIEVVSVDKLQLTDEPIVLQGVLELNDADPEHHMYMLKKAARVTD